MSDKNRILSVLKNIRNKEMETNAFFLPAVWNEILEDSEYVLNDNLIAAIKRENMQLDRLYYSAKNKAALNGLIKLTNMHDGIIITDILSCIPEETGAYSFFLETGAEVYSIFERREVKKNTDTMCNNDRIKFADISMTDKFYNLIISSFDKFNSYLPKYDEIRRAIEKNEIIYIGEQSIEAFAFFENTNRTTVTLRYIFVMPEARRAHYASMLLDYGMQRGGIRYTLWVDTMNEPAKHLYGKYGYKYNGLKCMTLRIGGKRHE